MPIKTRGNVNNELVVEMAEGESLLPLEVELELLVDNPNGNP